MEEDTQFNKPLGVAVKAIIRKNGRILLLQRSPYSGFDPGLWEFPGGKIEYGENLTEALKREVMEEAGLLIRVGQPVKTWHFIKEPFWVTSISFSCDHISGRVTLSPEHTAYAWVDPKEYEEYPLSTAMEK
jgi:8-oxo-dGTP diphosphatase